MTERRPAFAHMMVVNTDPLMWPEAENPAKSSRHSPAWTVEQSFFDFITGLQHHPGSMDHFIDAYRSITAEESAAPLPEIPEEHQLTERLLQPLRNAKAAYVLRNYFGVIALSGLVAEMVAILIFEMANLGINEHDQKLLFGRDFADLGQERRVDVLKAKALIDPQQVEWFGTLRSIRRTHLHFLDHAAPTAQEARTAYRCAYGLLATTVKEHAVNGPRYREGFRKHLERRGAIHVRRMLPEEVLAPALHEAGHALARRHFGQKIVSVTIVPDGDCLGLTTTSEKLNPAAMDLEEMEREMVVILSGAIAEEVGLFKKGPIPNQGDEDAANAILEQLPDPKAADSMYERAQQRSRQIIASEWHVLGKIADHLAEKKTLTGDEIEKIVTDGAQRIAERRSDLEPE